MMVYKCLMRSVSHIGVDGNYNDTNFYFLPLLIIILVMAFNV